jgi:hypothetical protein
MSMKNIVPNCSNFRFLFLERKRSKKIMSKDGNRKGKRKIVLYDDETPRRRVVAIKSNLAERLGKLVPDPQVIDITGRDTPVTTAMTHKVFLIGVRRIPSDSVGPPGCKLNELTVQSRWLGIERIKSLDGTFTRIIFYYDLTEDVLRHPHFVEIYGDPMTRFLPDRALHYDQPFDHTADLVRGNDIRRNEFLRRTFNRLYMLSDGNRISTIMMICHPFL